LSRRGALALLVAAAGTVSQAAPGERFLVIGASDASPASIARQAQALAEGGVATGDGPGLVFSTADCGDRSPVFAWAAAAADSAAAAQAVLARLRPRVPDAYVKRCALKPGSLLALGLPAVDASIASVPQDAVNWSDSDRISNVLPWAVPGSGARLVLQRHHLALPDDPLEGRRTRVLMAQPGAAPIPLLDDCVGAQGALLSSGWLALTCESEQAADQVLHKVHVFTSAGVAVARVPHCRLPRLAAADTLQCQAETVDALGRMRLSPRTLHLQRP